MRETPQSYQLIFQQKHSRPEERHHIIKALKGKKKKLQPRILYPGSLSFRIEGDIKSFPDKHKLKEFITIKPTLQ